ncbi:MAG: DUF4238 domain-containing protein [Acidobacteriota bacterium]
MPGYENQHFVPQSYLRRFSPDKNRKRVYVYDKVLGRSLGLIGIRSVANKSFFYDIPLDAIKQGFSMDPHLEEKALHSLESQFNEVIEVGIRVANGAIANLEHRRMMSLCIAVQLIRTLDYRRHLVEATERSFEAAMDSVLELAKPELALKVRAQAKYDEQAASLLHAKFMWNPDFVCRIAAVLYHRIWVIGVNDTIIPLYTSDTPVVLQAHKQRDSFMPDPSNGPAFIKAIDVVIESRLPGIEDEGVELAFPLSPKCALIILENKHFKYIETNQGKRYSLQPTDIIRLNSLQVLRSSRQVYSVSNDFSLAEKICSDHPDICSESKDSVKIEKWRWVAANR